MRPGGVRSFSVSQSTGEIWKTAPSTPIFENCERKRHRATFLCSLSRENPDRNPYQGHAPLRQPVRLALFSSTAITNRKLRSFSSL